MACTRQLAHLGFVLTWYGTELKPKVRPWCLEPGLGAGRPQPGDRNLGLGVVRGLGLSALCVCMRASLWARVRQPFLQGVMSPTGIKGLRVASLPLLLLKLSSPLTTHSAKLGHW